MVEADCDIIVCIVGWAVRNGSVEDKVGFGELRSEMQGTVVKVEVGTESGRAEYEG